MDSSPFWEEQSLSSSRNSLRFLKLEVSFPWLQEPTNRVYCELEEPSPHPDKVIISSIVLQVHPHEVGGTFLCKAITVQKATIRKQCYFALLSGLKTTTLTFLPIDATFLAVRASDIFLYLAVACK